MALQCCDLIISKHDVIEVQKTDGVTEIPYDRWDVDEYFDPSPNAVGRISDIKCFFSNTSSEKVQKVVSPDATSLFQENGGQTHENHHPSIVGLHRFFQPKHLVSPFPAASKACTSAMLPSSKTPTASMPCSLASLEQRTAGGLENGRIFGDGLPIKIYRNNSDFEF